MTNLKNLIKQIYYFGSSKDGFNTYPESNAFSHYYNNCAPEKWLLTLRKANFETVYHTFVRYGLHTSLNDGRTGSHIGISIAINDYYFKDLKFLQEKFATIINIMLKEKELIEEYGNFADPVIGFVPLRLSHVNSYLEEWNERIAREFNKKNVRSKLTKLSPDIPNGDTYYRLHADSKKEIIQRYFEKSGAVYIADHEKYPIVSK